MGRSLFLPGGGGKARVAAGHYQGVRSSQFQGFAWQTLFARLSNDGMLGHLLERLPPWLALWMVLRFAAQNDCEGLFGIVCKGLPMKPPPRELGPRFQDAEFIDFMNHCAERAQSWAVDESKRKKYDSANSMASLIAAVLFNSGDGDARSSKQAVEHQLKQLKDAMAAAAGRQESARTFNNFFADAKALVSGAKREVVERPEGVD